MQSRSFHVVSVRPAGDRRGRVVPTIVADHRVAASRSGRAASRRARSSSGPARRARPGWRSACRAGRAAAPSRSSSRRTRAWLPPTCSASATAASFALWISAASTRSRTVSRSPGRRLIDDSPTAAARPLTVTTSSRRACSSVTSTVISFVMLAIGRRSRSCPRREHLAGGAVLDEIGAAGDLRGAPRRRRARSRGRRERAPSRSFTGAKRASAAATLTRIALAERWSARRLDARVRAGEQSTVDRGREAGGDRVERVAALDHVELRRRAPTAVGGAPRSPSPWSSRPCRRRSPRRLVRAQRRADEQHDPRDREQERPAQHAPACQRAEQAGGAARPWPRGLPAGDGPHLVAAAAPPRRRRPRASRPPSSRKA